MIRSSFLFVFSILSITLLVFSLSTPKRIIPDPVLETTSNNVLPDVIAITPKTRYFDKQGRLSSQLVADKLEYFGENKNEKVIYGSTQSYFAHLENPALSFNQNQSLWQLNSREGLVFDKQDTANFSGNVVLEQKNEKGHLEVKTSTLDVYLEDEYASTEQDITITSENGKINAKGMRADFKKEHIELKSKVKGQHAPL